MTAQADTPAGTMLSMIIGMQVVAMISVVVSAMIGPVRRYTS